MRCKPHAIALAAAAAVLSTGAIAQDAGLPTFAFSGFGTVGIVQTDTDLAEYGIAGQPKGATKTADAGVDSKLGVQGTVTFNPMFSATAQLLSKRNWESKWTPELEWGFVKAKINDTFTARVGRMGTPYFMVSDFRNVGYANTWIRPPLEVYNQVPVPTFDGADLLISHTFGDVNVNAQLYGGQSKAELPGGAVVKAKDLFGFAVTAEVGPVTLRAGHAQTKLDVDSQRLDTVLGGLRALGAAGLADEMSVDGKGASFSGIGASLDWNKVIGSVEYTWRRTEAYLADTAGWSALGGYRIGTFTPYVQYASLRQKSKTSVGSPTPSAVLNAGANALYADVGQDSTALGLRWDAYKNVAIKAQYDRVKTHDNGNGQFINPKPGFGSDAVNVFAVAVDFVW